jgi:hypothetical protein
MSSSYWLTRISNEDNMSNLNLETRSCQALSFSCGVSVYEPGMAGTTRGSISYGTSLTPMRIWATRSTEDFEVPLKSARSLSSMVAEPPARQRVVVLSADDPLPSELFPLVRGCVAAAVFGTMTCTMSHSKASWFSCPLSFVLLCVGGVCSVIHSRICRRACALYVSLSSQRRKKTFKYGVCLVFGAFVPSAPAFSEPQLENQACLLPPDLRLEFESRRHHRLRSLRF